MYANFMVDVVGVVQSTFGQLVVRSRKFREAEIPTAMELLYEVCMLWDFGCFWFFPGAETPRTWVGLSNLVTGHWSLATGR